MGASRRYRRRRNGSAVYVLPDIPDDASPETKDALALRQAANVTGTCPSCGATFETVWMAPNIGQQTMAHESWCQAATDPPGHAEAVAAELRRWAEEERGSA